MKITSKNGGLVKFIDLDKIWVCDYCGDTQAGGLAFVRYDIPKKKDLFGCLVCYSKLRAKQEQKVEEMLKNAGSFKDSI